MYILDTSTVIEILNGLEKSNTIHSLIRNKPVATTTFSIFEILLGVRDQYKDTFYDFINSIHVISFDTSSAQIAADIYKNLKKFGKLIDDIDIFIAAIAINHSCTLITLDNDFSRIKGLDATIIK